MLKMRVVIKLLVLLLSMCGSHTLSTQTEVHTESQSTGAAAAVTTEKDVSAELRELRDMVVEMKVTLSPNQNELLDTKDMLKKIDAEMTIMKIKMMQLIEENSAQESELRAVKTRLATSETEVVNLEKKITERPKVAFSAGLTNSGFVSSGSYHLNLVFSKIFTNVGQAYSTISGGFTAPVRGVYYFRFTVSDVLYSRSMVITMYKNGGRLMHLTEYDTDGKNSYLSSGLTLQLEVGDWVNLGLPAGRYLYDDTFNYRTFSGFLLFDF